MNKSNSQGMSLFRLLVVLAVIGGAVMLGRSVFGTSKPAAVLAGAAPGITYLDESDNSPILVRWDAREGSGQRPAPSLALHLRHTDRYAWWFRDGERWSSSDPKGPEELHLSAAVPGHDSFPVKMFTPLCEADEQPFARCRDGLARLILHRQEFHTEAEAVLTGTREPPVDESLPHEKRPKKALMEFWTQSDAGTGQQRLVGWVCPDGLRQELDTAPPLATLVSGGPDARLRCFQPPTWWQRLAPGRFGFEKQPVYFRCEPQAACRANFFYRGRDVELQQEQAYALASANAGAVPWLDLALFVASWESLERMRADALQASAPAAELEEARVQLEVCEALVGEGRRWISGHGGLADDPSSSLDPFTAWNKRSLPCRRAASHITRLSETDPAVVEPLLKRLIPALESIGANEADPLAEVWVSALEKSGKAETLDMFEALAATLAYFRGHGEYDKEIPRKLARLEQAWRLALSLDPPVAPEKLGAVARELAEMRRTQNDSAGRSAVYEQWVKALDQRGAPRQIRLEALDALANDHWSRGSFLTFRQAIDALRDAYLAPAADSATVEDQERLAKTAFYIVFYYRCYAVHEQAYAEVAPDIVPVIARMEQEFGADSRWFKAARFHQDEVTRRKPAPNGTPIGGGFLGY